jgi:hypothetical protein
MDAAPAAACRALRPTRARRPFAQTRGRLSPVGSLSRHNSARSSNERPPAIAPVASNGSAKPCSTTTATSARSEGRTAAASHHPSEQDIYFSPELPMIGPGVHERSYIAREAKLLDLALTLSPATLGAWPMSWMPATYGGAPTEAPGRSHGATTTRCSHAPSNTGSPRTPLSHGSSTIEWTPAATSTTGTRSGHALGCRPTSSSPSAADRSGRCDTGRPASPPRLLTPSAP